MKAIKFTQRESIIIKLKKEGLSDRMVATQLGISYWTVRSYLSRAKIKLECQTTLELISKCCNRSGYKW